MKDMRNSLRTQERKSTLKHLIHSKTAIRSYIASK